MPVGLFPACIRLLAPAAVETPTPQWGFGSAEEIVMALCSREMEGRTVGSRGGLRTAEYIAGAFEAAGLVPFEGDSFLIEYMDQTAEPLAAEPEVAVIAADGTEAGFTAGIDYIYTHPFQDVDVQLPVSGKKTECEAGKALFLPKISARRSNMRRKTGKALRLWTQPGRIRRAGTARSGSRAAW